jgi:hypothetical protein
MSVFEPEAVESQGNIKVLALPAVAIKTAVDLSTEVAAGIDVSLTFNAWNPGRTPNTGTTPRRLGTRDQFPREGNMQYAAIPVTYPYDPQATAGDANNEAMETLTEGSVQEFLVRKGLDAELPLAVGQKYELWECRCGAQIEGESGDDEFAEFQIQQNLYPLRKVAKGAIVA